MRGFLLELSLDGTGTFQYGISDCPVYPRTLYARFTVYIYQSHIYTTNLSYQHVSVLIHTLYFILIIQKCYVTDLTVTKTK